MALLLPTRWQRQPQGQVEIDWSHPLARGLTGLWIFNTPFPVNLVNGKKTSGTKPNYLGTPNGVGYGGTDVLLDTNVENLISGINGSILYYGFGNETSGSAVNFTLGGTSPLFGINANTTSIGSLWNSSAAYTSIPRSGSKKVVFSSNASGRRVFNNGAFVQTLAAGSATSATGNFYLTYNNAFKASTACNVIATWNRPLSDKEALLASRNIYQILRPMRSFDLISDPNIFNLTDEISSTLAAPDIEFNGLTLGAGDMLEALDSTLSAPSITFEGAAGLYESMSANVAPDLFLNGVTNSAGSFAASLPSVGIALSGLVGVNEPIASTLIAPDVEMDGLFGVIGAFDLPMVGFDVALSEKPSISVTTSAPDVQFVGATGVIGSFAIEAGMNSTFNGLVGRIGGFDLNLVPNIAFEGASSRIGDIPLSANVNVAFDGYVGMVQAFDMTMPAIDVSISAGQSGEESFNLDMPAVNITFAGVNNSTRQLKFFNRYTR